MIASLIEDGENAEALFTGGYGPAPLTEAERHAIAAPPLPAPAWVLGEYPEWLEPELARAFGDDVAQEMAALVPRAPVDLRVNTLKTVRDQVIAALKADGIACAPTPYAPHGVRIAHEVAKLSKSPLFESGGFEFQDEAAQIAYCLCNAAPDERVLDLAAGAGGKSLALAAAMQDRGEIVACDVRGEALSELGTRAARAGATIIRTLLLEHATPEGEFGLVLVDAPCSGSGTWRRQPELRWRLTPERLAELTRNTGPAAGPGGRAGRGPAGGWSMPPARSCPWKTRTGRKPSGPAGRALPPWICGKAGPEPARRCRRGLAADFRASPSLTGTDGFYCAGFRRS